RDRTARPCARAGSLGTGPERTATLPPGRAGSAVQLPLSAQDRTEVHALHVVVGEVPVPDVAADHLAGVDVDFLVVAATGGGHARATEREGQPEGGRYSSASQRTHGGSFLCHWVRPRRWVVGE